MIIVESQDVQRRHVESYMKEQEEVVGEDVCPSSGLANIIEHVETFRNMGLGETFLQMKFSILAKS